MQSTGIFKETRSYISESIRRKRGTNKPKCPTINNAPGIGIDFSVNELYSELWSRDLLEVFNSELSCFNCGRFSQRRLGHGQSFLLDNSIKTNKVSEIAPAFENVTTCSQLCCPTYEIPEFFR